jgi:hypothetical protein
MRNGELELKIAVAATKQDIAVRLRPVCDHLCEAEFDALVQRMAEIDVHYRLRSDWTISRHMDEQERVGPSVVS